MISLDWKNNIVSILDGNGTDKCPFCGSANMDYSTQEIFNNMGYAVIWCNDCKRAFNMSRLLIKSSFERNTKIPVDLIF